ncbi:MAG: hypothetical protein U9R40_01595 [Synergistota bacterium]|nr:hypothetical protein [Synergistota bacterium]
MSESDVLQSKAAVEQARASLRLAEIDLDHTRIKAPISGQAGKALFTRGNYVTPTSGNLTTIVQKDPVVAWRGCGQRGYHPIQVFPGNKKNFDIAQALRRGDVGGDRAGITASNIGGTIYRGVVAADGPTPEIYRDTSILERCNLEPPLCRQRVRS